MPANTNRSVENEMSFISPASLAAIAWAWSP